MKSITKEELFQIQEGFSITERGNFDWEYQEISREPYKHDESRIDFVFKGRDDLWYQGCYFQSYNWGIIDEDINLIRVEPHKIETIEWRPIK